MTAKDKTWNPWEEQDALNAAIEKGAVFTHQPTGWKFKLRHVTQWSPHLRRATTIVLSKPDVEELMKAKAAGTKLTPEMEAVDAQANLEIGIRGSLMQWSGVVDRNGKPLPLNVANALMVFGHFHQLWSDIAAFAGDPANYGIKPRPVAEVPDGVDAAGNSSGTSDTASEDSTASSD